ncbi:TPA: nitroreductase family protein, partial [Bacillus anthracis]|nr:nitroreductase family protein [Bacillus anthracis]
GFNPQALSEEFNVSSRYVPIMLITIGESTLKGHPAPRMSVEQVSEWAK